ncbi:MAG TPA: uroporphyrinogen decarboxylase [Rhodothermales bacterium]|nr:uroporphyrinogen decarboxylase [Rhodothermales bacterium]
MHTREATSFPVTTNDRLLRAAKGDHVDRAPVWLMRQAGRYLPEYRKAREGRDFFDTCRDPDLVAEITLQPIRRFPLDAAIIFSDILVVPQAMGMTVEMVPGRGPVFPNPLASTADVAALIRPDVDESLGYVFEAIARTRTALDGRVPLIGFSGAPWTLMAYMVEGSGSKTFSKARAWLHTRPRESQNLLEMLTETIIEYLAGQIRAGAQMVQLFDSWAGLLGPADYRRHAFPYLVRIGEALKLQFPDVPLALFPRGAHYILEDVAESPYDVLSLDWTIDPAVARRRTRGAITQQGNLDPILLFAETRTIRESVRTMIEGFGLQRYIANLGHGMMPEHDPERVADFVRAVHEFSTDVNEKG